MRTRRSFLGFAALSPRILSADQPKTISELWTDFLLAAKDWVPVQNEVFNGHGAISPVQALAKWEEVRKAFHEVDVAVRNQ